MLCGVSFGAVEVRVDYGFAADPSGGNWNNVTASLTNYDLIDFNTGLDTGINGLSGGNPASAGGSFAKDWFGTTASSDMFFTTQHVANIAFFSNVPVGEYMVEILLSGDFAEDQLGAEFTIIGDTTTAADRTYNGTPVPSEPWNFKIDGFQPQNWLIWDSVSPNASGTLTIRSTKELGTFNSTGVNAIRITTAVPEASSYSLLVGLGAMLVMLRRRSA